MDKEKNILLKLIGRSLFDESIEISNDVDWQKLSDLAMKHTVLPLVINSLSTQELEKVPKGLKSMWRNFSMQALLANEALLSEQHRVIALIAESEVPCVILKGSSVAINYPNPELRMMGDIDLLVKTENQMNVIRILQAAGYGDVRNPDHSVHKGISNGKFTVEIHNKVSEYSNNAGIHDGLSSLFEDGISRRVFKNGIPMLPDEMQAVSLLLHKFTHLKNEGLGLRQLCDWAMFIHKRMTAELWLELKPRLKEFGLLNFAGVVTRACVDYLYLPENSAPWAMKYSGELEGEIMDNILESGNFGSLIKESRYNVNENENNMKVYTSFLIEKCKEHWPICDKYKFLLPVAPLFAYPSYRKKHKGIDDLEFHPIGMYKKAGQKQKLIKELKLFEPEE